MLPLLPTIRSLVTPVGLLSGMATLGEEQSRSTVVKPQAAEVLPPQTLSAVTRQKWWCWRPLLVWWCRRLWLFHNVGEAGVGGDLDGVAGAGARPGEGRGQPTPVAPLGGLLRRLSPRRRRRLALL